MSRVASRLAVFGSLLLVFVVSCGPTTTGSDASDVRGDHPSGSAGASGGGGTGAGAGTGGGAGTTGGAGGGAGATAGTGGAAGSVGSAGTQGAPDASDDADRPQDLPVGDGPAGVDADAAKDVPQDIVIDVHPDVPAEAASDVAHDGPAPDVVADVVEVPTNPCASAATGATCSGGHCCAGQCVPNDIHACGATCAACATTNGTPSCNGTSCAIACNTGFGDCDTTAPGCETDTRVDKNHCGSCTKVCTAGNSATPSCAAGVCGSTCQVGFGDCDDGVKHDGSDANGCEAALNTATHCGSCTTACSRPNSNATCNVAGTTYSCAYTCKAGFKDCDLNGANGCEIDIMNDDLNCGKCQTKPAVSGDIQNPDNWCAATLDDAVGACKVWLDDRCVLGRCTNCRATDSTEPVANYCDSGNDYCVYNQDTNDRPVACNGGCQTANCGSSFSCPPP